MRYFSQTLVTALLLAALVPTQLPAQAQDQTGKDLIRAPKQSTAYVGTKRLLLEGYPDDLASYKSPGFLDVAAEIIDVDGEKKIVNARNSVSIKAKLAPENGQGETVYIESNSDVARLTLSDRRLILTGNLSGYYRIGNGPQTTLKGNRATFDYSGDVLKSLVEGDAQNQVEIKLPGEAQSKADAFGPVTLRADSLRIDEKNGTAYFIGNARAFSTDGNNKLDVTAPSFTLQRAADGTIGLLTTKGRTVTKLDVPPDASATGVGKPTHLEVTADKAVVNRANSTGVFEGNVTGFYRLQAGATPGENFNFSGGRATITYDPKAAQIGDGLSVVLIRAPDAPADIQVPSFNLNSR